MPVKKAAVEVIDEKPIDNDNISKEVRGLVCYLYNEASSVLKSRVVGKLPSLYFLQQLDILIVFLK